MYNFVILFLRFYLAGCITLSFLQLILLIYVGVFKKKLSNKNLSNKLQQSGLRETDFVKFIFFSWTGLFILGHTFLKADRKY